jgi:transcription-repair coupling factor (superfamily II helicase)
MRHGHTPREGRNKKHQSRSKVQSLKRRAGRPDVRAFARALFLEPTTLESIARAREAGRVSVPGEAFSFYAAALFVACGKLVVITKSPARAETVYSELSSFLDPSVVRYFPDFETLPYERARVAHGRQALRLEALDALSSRNPAVIVIPAPALLRRFPPRKAYEPPFVTVRRGMRIDFDHLVETLVDFGYERTELVDAPGSFAVRGGIIDVFPSARPEPVRIEFFGDDVDSVRVFDLETQLSRGVLEEVRLTRESDTPLAPAQLAYARETMASELETRFAEDREAGNSLSPYWPFLYENLSSLEDELGEHLVLVEDREGVVRELRRREREVSAVWEGPFEIPAPYEAYFRAAADVEAALDRWDTLDAAGFENPGISVQPAPAFHGGDIGLTLGPFLKAARVVRVYCGFDTDPERVRKSVERLLGEEYRIAVEAVPGYLEKGFVFDDARVIFVPATYFLGPRVVLSVSKPVARRRFEEALQARPGDLVVHAKYGIGRYTGIVREIREGVEREYVVLEYADGTLRMPVEHVDQVTRYAGDAEAVALDSLSSNEWKKARDRARRAARKLAFNLIRVHAERELSYRPPYDVENPWLREFEDLFPFEETEDQLRAIHDVYRDLSSDRPMERLVVGDVGFGKTEVAMRAAFAVALSGRRVLVICPTTVLAEQHFETWSQRFASFPIRIGMVSRFVAPARRREAIESFNAGAIDVLIGTHALLTKAVSTTGLGLVVLDEEHLFGVNQKEYFKARKPDVDMLFLSATPIPRTLQLALSGIREISLIETPPPGRMPVMTHVGTYDEELVRLALENEIERGGQALYTHNRIERLPAIKKKLEALVPGARVTIAHGQMRERDLEKAMVSFWRGEADILVTTTIVESGLDMPLVNTLIVEGAENFGLAQAYQLRGRIGRSYRQAYAYFFHSDSALSDVARKRLRALVELSDLGAGFRLALRDLEIRGAGNLLGPEQHGHISRVGVDLFLDFLHQELELLKTGAVPKMEREVQVDVPLPVVVPDAYVGGLKAKYEVYMRASTLADEQDVERFLDELRDRFGEPPAPVKNLCYLALARNMAARVGITLIAYRGGTLRLSGPGVNETLLEASPLLRGASYSLGSLRLAVRTDEIVRVVIDVLADIIAALHSGKEQPF